MEVYGIYLGLEGIPISYVCTTIDSTKLEHGFRTIYAGFPSYSGLVLEDSHVPTFWILLYIYI